MSPTSPGTARSRRGQPATEAGARAAPRASAAGAGKQKRAPGCSVAGLLAGSLLPGIEARILLAHVLGVDRAWIAAHPEAAVAGRHAAEAQSLFERRREGEPIAYLTGEREFFGLAFHVTRDVLIPRPETERLAELALERLPRERASRVLDLCTGSGAVAVALAHARPLAQVTASDVSERALALAARNAVRHSVSIRIVRSRWFEALAGEKYDLVVCNPPYVASGDPHLRAGDLRFEPRIALDGGADGLACIRAVAGGAAPCLVPGGWLLLEHGYDQGAACVELLRLLGYGEVADYADLADLPRVCAGRLPV